ncbi:MAG: heme o synthase [Planctomycetota bacterium]
MPLWFVQNKAPAAACVSHWLSIGLRLSRAALVSMVVLTMAAGFLLASPRGLSLEHLVWAILGTASTAAGASTLNQWWEVQLDRLMRRTAARPLPAQQLRTCYAFWGAAGACACGLCVLACGTNVLAAALGACAAAIYVLVYTPLKKRSTLCTLVGAVCGAIPPLLGWAAAGGSLEAGAWLLAVILYVWQIPHVLALTWLHRADLRRAGFRILPLLDSTGRSTSQFCLLYSLALVPLSLCLPLTQLASWQSTAGIAAASVVMVVFSFRLYRQRDDASARALFRYSLAYLPLIFVLRVAL